jgi:hypothetical protein
LPSGRATTNRKGSRRSQRRNQARQSLCCFDLQAQLNEAFKMTGMRLPEFLGREIAAKAEPEAPIHAEE